MGTRNVETGFIIYDPAVTAFGNDPLQNLLIAEGDDAEAEALGAYYESGTHRRATCEAERTWSDMLGASPFEVWMHHRERFEEL